MSEVLLKSSSSNEPIAVRLERADDEHDSAYHVTVGGKSLDAELIEWQDDTGLLRIAGRVIPFAVLRNGQRIDVWLGGRTYSLELIDQVARRTASGPAAAMQSKLAAPMPGTILKINVAPGDSFEAHQPLIVMESMKMEMTLSAPHAGRVREVACKPGQLVDMGAMLVRFEEPAA
jgi:3-methylcrotonyl-CoA carboxylase alpha subunit